MFATGKYEILELIDQIDPVRYGKTRNFLDGAVTKLSPYLSRGVISTKQVAVSLLKKGYTPSQMECLLKELAWRDYFQQVWIAKGGDIHSDLKQPQFPVTNHEVPERIISANCSIEAIDTAIQELYKTGYMHNHLRMYVASLACNVAKSHWILPARWMYYHLLDADWASNALSWQWVAGSFSNKKYYANQENINKYCHTHQSGTFLDIAYADFENMPVPDLLKSTVNLDLKTNLPVTDTLRVDESLPIYVYNFYNLDFNWGATIRANRILLLEPDFFEQYPVSDRTIQFLLSLSGNIDQLQVIVGRFDEVFRNYPDHHIHYKEHPLNLHYRGIMHPREWMFKDVQGYYPSFFSYWKKCEKMLSQLQNG